MAKVVLLTSLLVAGLASGVYAADKLTEMHGPSVVVPPQPEGLSRAAGDDCLTPILVDQSAFPFIDAGQTTCGRGNVYGTLCETSYGNGEDIIYELTINSEITVDITMDPLGTTWTVLAILDACPDVGTCIAWDTGSSGVREINGLTLAPGSYWIVVDTWPTPNCIPAFDLTIAEATPPGPGESCETAVVLVDDEIVNSAPFAPYWYVFTGPNEAWTLILDSCIEGQTADTYVRVYDACGGTQIASNDDMGSACPGNVFASHLEVELAPNQTVYILWDDVYSSVPFDFNLFVEINGVANEASNWSSVKDLYR